jgi:hypothetical protein
MTDLIPLTLRSLLSYREGLLPPEEHDLIEAKIQDAPAAQRLESHIREMLRFGNSSTPEILPGECERANPTSPLSTATAVAEYIDNILSKEELAAFERSCIDSNELLAEVAECLRMLSAMRHEPALKSCLPADKVMAIRDATRQKIAEPPLESNYSSPRIYRNESTGNPPSPSLSRSEAKWIVKRGQHKSRPLSVEEIRKQAETGELEETDLLWRYGGDVWLPAVELAEQLNLEFSLRYRHTPKQSFHSNERRRIMLGGIALPILMLCCVAVLFRPFFLSTRSVTAELTYPDGSPLPLSELLVRFHPLSRPLNAETLPKPHEIVIDPGVISFQVPHAVTARITPNRPSHRITLHRVTGEPLPSNVVANAYSEPRRTPLLVNAADHESVISLTVELVAEQFRGPP